MLRELLLSVEEATKLNHRRLIVLLTSRNEEAIRCLTTILAEILNSFGEKGKRILYAYHSSYEDSKLRKELFEKLLGSVPCEVDYVTYPESFKVLGSTYDHAILDLVNDLRPNDIGRLIGVIKGGGVVFLLTPKFEHWVKMLTRFQENLITIGHKAEDVRRIFVRRFISKLREYEGVIIIDAEKNTFIKPPTLKGQVKVWRRPPLSIPEKTVFPKRAYSLAITQDQVEVIKLMEVLYERPKEGKVAIVITADRGRGKSCAVGIGVAALAYKLRRAKGRAKLLITAPSLANVQSLFSLALKTLEAMGQEVEVEVEEGLMRGIKGKGIEITYAYPLEASRSDADILVVDEAAGLQVPMLFRLKRRFKRLVFSSTIHGYEGAGRGFSVRFLKMLKEDPQVKVLEYEMSEPIRYASNDPIERWLFDTLLLDAEPAKLDEDDLEAIKAGEVEYLKPQLEEFFLKEEDLLRQFVGIYVMAHYRNNPDDLGMMMDAPHHTVRALRLRNGKVLTAIELAEEGGIVKEVGRRLAQGAWVAGNIIPDRILKHYRLLGFGELKGWRIVRIATHPSVQGMGLGSKALTYICEEAKELGYDWVGAGFGVNVDLLRYWIKNGFYPVHISPDRNPVSGEYTVIVIKPLTKRAKDYVRLANREFRIKLVNSLHEPYHDLEPKVASLLLKAKMSKGGGELSLTPIQVGRLLSYAWNLMTLENCFDAVRELAKCYFLDDKPKELKLSRLEELLLIVRVLQAKSWRVTCNQLNIKPPVAMDGLRTAIRKLCEHYLKASKECLENYFIEP